jgi:hypothetical protein
MAARLREMREARFSKSSSGGVDGHARPSGLPSLAGHKPATGARATQVGETGEAGIKPGPLDIKRGRPRIGEKHERHEPWKALGLTERTYYRRKAEQRRADGSR